MPLLALAVGAVLGTVVGYVGSKPRYHTPYIGEYGIASYEYGGRDKTIGKASVFTFDRGATLKTMTTRDHTNGAYTGTTYAYTWTNATRKMIHSLAGRFQNKEGDPPPEDAYWFAVAA